MIPAHFVIVDDDAINNRLCNLCIARHFGNVPAKSFQNSEAALQFIAANYDAIAAKPTILFLDIHMPYVSGWEFLKRFSAFDESIQAQFKIFILSASTSPAQVVLANQHPLVTGFLSKPLTESKLEQAFRALPEHYGITCFR